MVFALPLTNVNVCEVGKGRIVENQSAVAKIILKEPAPVTVAVLVTPANVAKDGVVNPVMYLNAALVAKTEALARLQ